MRSFRSLFGLAVGLTVTACLGPLAAAQAARSGGTAGTSPATNPPLTLQVTCNAGGQTPLLRVQIANTSDRPISFVLGFTPTKGQAQVVNAINVIAIRPATGADEAYVYVNPTHALQEGAPWVLALAPGATHALELPIFDFISSNTFANLDPTAASGARLVLEGRPGGKGSTPIWTGRVETKIDQCA